MSKNSLLINKILDKPNIAILCILAMMIGFLSSPALCSIAVFLFGINAIRDINPINWFKQKWWLLGVLWIACFAITWFWSVDKAYWGERLRVKLPFLILPLAFAFLPKFTSKQIQFITLCVGIILLAGAWYSISFLVNDYAYYKTEYMYSHLLPTPVRGDHIRFSLSIALYILWGWFAFPLLQNKIIKWVVAICIALLFVYLHILAAKSGIISLYLFLFAWSLYIAITKKKIVGIIVGAGFVLMIVLAVNYIPTLKKRYEYMMMSLQILKSGDKSSNYGDINRLISYKIALKIIGQHPFAGVGIGNMEHEMKIGYDTWYPEVIEENRLLPHNEFLVAGMGCGIPVMLLVLIWIFYPLSQIRRNKESFYFFMVWLILFFQLMIEPVLEVQYGVFVFLFFLLMQWHTLPGKNNTVATL